MGKISKFNIGHNHTFENFYDNDSKKRCKESINRNVNSLIPGGAHTYSKGEDQFPYNSPKLIDRGHNCTLWDNQGKSYTDLAMSLGTVILGHAYKPIIDAVKYELDRGVNFCRPSIIEGELAELLIDIIPSAEMVKFAKNGSDAVTAAIKLARAYTGRKYIVRCRNDAFNAIHDWFIGSTVIKRGIPAEVSNLTLKFNYNNIEDCKRIIKEHKNEIACFILEPLSIEKEKNNFLKELKILCEKNGIILIFDEVVSGFRYSLGGAQEFAGVTPHISAFGKAMANGFSVSALVGQKEFMKLGGLDHDQERVFLLSTTHGGETHSLAASIACINEIKKLRAIDHFWKVGEQLTAGFYSAAKKVGAEKYFNVMSDYEVKPAFSFNDASGEISMKVRTFFLQEMTKKGILMPYIVPSYAHKDDDIKFVINCFEETMETVKLAIENENLDNLIVGDITKPVFRKFN